MARVTKNARKKATGKTKTTRRKASSWRTGVARPVSNVQDEIYAIHEAQSEYREAFNSGDVERMLRVFAAEFTEMGEGVPTFFGQVSREVLRRRMTRLFEQFNTRMALAIVTVQVLGGTAYSHGWRELTLEPKSGGGLRKARLRFLELWERNAAGKWKLQMVIENLEPPLALPDVELPIPWFRTEIAKD